TNAGPNPHKPAMDHPGGMQFDGELLWIPIATSRPGGESYLCAFDVRSLRPDRTAAPMIRYGVGDHIGALAASRKLNLIAGANWDTGKIYLWNFNGQLLQTITASGFVTLQVHAGPDATEKTGVAIQDWKFFGSQLYAAGLVKAPAARTTFPRSHLLLVENFPNKNSHATVMALEGPNGVELAAEGMTIDAESVWFLPEDLGTSNRLFRLKLRLIERQLR
ncbi:MAG: DUF6454 family protein, partial [Verrucomicrobiae bacterium]|nr:DUF6454 family protein [Verrucomicrobiae bacterium]